MKTVQLKQKYKDKLPELKKEHGASSDLGVPRIMKVVVSSGTGKAADRRRKNEFVEDRLSKITGQKPSPRPAKQSIASFKIREGDIIGYSVTLRGDQMYSFLDKLLHVAFPRTRDFKGVDEKIVDEMGNATIGIPEHTVFPETSDEELRDVFGLSITIVTTAQNRKDALAFLKALDFPFKKAKTA